MKVDSGSQIANRPLRPVRAADRAGAGSFAAHLSGTQAGGVGSAVSISHAAALVALQAADEIQERRQRALRRGSRLLDLLDEIRVGLLGESLEQRSIAELARAVAESRASIDDPGLEAVLDAIDLRAQVELAKYEQTQAGQARAVTRP